MEKKGVRSGQPSQKGIQTDSKKNQDNVTGKLWPRGGRRREPAGASFSVKSEANRKPVPSQRIDKRPKPRGSYYSGSAGQVGGKEEARLAEQEAELGSVFVQGSKKQSLNHLLNFHYTPRESHAPRSSASGSHRWLSTQKHKYNKEQFLQANCQFVVNSNGNYSAYLNSPDALVDWNFIEQINVQVFDFPSCPICLYDPVAAKMTRCGHIYCWSCILHYLALSDKTWRKCPICFEAVHKTDLKTVVPVPHSTFNVGQEITFRLMKRGRGILTPTPVDFEGGQLDENVLLPMSADPRKTMYSKLLVANNCNIFHIIERERKQLETQLLEDENAPEKCFIEQALALLLEREKVLINTTTQAELNSEAHIEAENLNLNLEYTKNVENRLKRNHLESLSSEGLGSDDFNGSVVESADLNTGIIAEDLDISATESSDIGATPSKYFYFYQALDGQHIYLHALNVRMLEHTYGSLEACPTTITGKIVEKESGSMTEELRNRLRYLQHLPITCQFEVAEIQLKTPAVTVETLNFFKDQIENRKRKRQRRAREEKRREKRIAEEENKQMGKFPEMRARIDSRFQFPEFSDSIAMDASFPVAIHSPSISERSNSPAAGHETEEFGALASSSPSGPSFAKMLATTKPPPAQWPVLSKPKSNELPRRLINVTGSGSSSATNQQRIRQNSDSEPEPDGYVPAPAYNQSFSDAIAMALQKASISAESTTKDGDAICSGKKKKKKAKQKVLFATTMTYSG